MATQLRIRSAMQDPDWSLSESMEVLTTQLTTARDNLSRITKRLKTMQAGQETDTPPASPLVDIEMELME